MLGEQEGQDQDMGQGQSSPRTRRKIEKDMDFQRMRVKQEHSARMRKLSKILRKPREERSEAEMNVLEENSSLVDVAENRIRKSLLIKERCQETEDSEESLVAKCNLLAEAIRASKRLVVYTGAGISTAASIPDYRGPNGIWTQLSKTGAIAGSCDVALAEPTFTHMAISQLFREKIVKHVVSQNCDGLHLRSGLPKENLSEIHGNACIEVCRTCKEQYIREFDVTEKTGLRRHKTGRKCRRCPQSGGDLMDTIVHFGEKGRLEWPLNWEGAAKAAKKADLIICLGSSLKILRKYHCLWPKGPPNTRPGLCIVNLQWTPKDSQATLKINGKCDTVMKLVVESLGLSVPAYSKQSDNLLKMYTRLQSQEEVTCNRIKLFDKSPSLLKSETNESLSPSSLPLPLPVPGWFGKGLRVKAGVKKKPSRLHTSV